MGKEKKVSFVQGTKSFASRTFRVQFNEADFKSNKPK